MATASPFPPSLGLKGDKERARDEFEIRIKGRSAALRAAIAPFARTARCRHVIDHDQIIIAAAAAIVFERCEEQLEQATQVWSLRGGKILKPRPRQSVHGRRLPVGT